MASRMFTRRPPPCLRLVQRFLCRWAAGICVLFGPTAALAEGSVPALPVAVDLSKAPLGSWADYSLYQGSAKAGSEGQTTVRWALVARDEHGATLEGTASGGPQLRSKVVLRAQIARNLGEMVVQDAVQKADLQLSSHEPIALPASVFGLQERWSKPNPQRPVGDEQVTTPGGTFQTSHQREGIEQGTLDIWLSDSVLPLGVVKMVLTPKKPGGTPITAELVKSGEGATTQITLPPVRLSPELLRKLSATLTKASKKPVTSAAKRALIGAPASEKGLALIAGDNSLRDALPPGAGVGENPLPRESTRVREEVLDALGKHWDFEDGTLQGFRHEAAPGDAGAFYSQPTFGDNVRASRALTTAQMRVPPNPCAGLILDAQLECERGAGAPYLYLSTLKPALDRLRSDLTAVGGAYWDTPFPIGQHGKYWIGTFEHRPSRHILADTLPTRVAPRLAAWGTTQGDRLTGRLVSPVVELRQKYFHLLVGGGCSEEVGVYLQSARPALRGSVGVDRLGLSDRAREAQGLKPIDPVTVKDEWQTLRDAAGKPIEARGFCVENMVRVSFDIQHLAGTQARVLIEDRATGAWGHLNVDDIWLTNTPPRPSERRRDPVWAVADLHAHLMNEKGFTAYSSSGVPEARALWGSAFGGIETLRECNDTHTTGDTGESVGSAYTLCRDLCLNLLEGAGLEEKAGDQVSQSWPLGGYHNTQGGYPNFVNWPLWYSAAHQQMHSSWVKRAYQGGVRLMVAAVGNSEVISFALAKERDRPFSSDQDALALQIPAIKDFASQNSAWAEVAYTPQDARWIINSGKLAIVIGVELDHVMDSCKADVTSQAHHQAHEYAHPDFWASQNGFDIGAGGTVAGVAGFLGAATRVMHYRGHPQTCSEAEIEARLEALYQQGVRQILPVHFSNNLLGGYAFNGDMFTASAVFGDPSARAPVLLSRPELERRYGDRVRPFVPAAVEGLRGDNERRRRDWQANLPFAFKLTEAQVPVWARLGPETIIDGNTLPPGIARTLVEFFSGQCIDDDGWRVVLGIFTGGATEVACGLSALSNEALDAARSSMPYEGALDTAMMIPLNLNSEQNAIPFHMNSRGLQPAGRSFLRAMMKRGMLIDIQHASELTKEDILSMTGPYPVMASHGGVALGAQRANENVLSSTQLRRIYFPPNSFAQGLVGLGTQSSHGLVEQIRRVATGGLEAGEAREQELQTRGVALGTDLNGMDWHAAPRFGQFGYYEESPRERRDRFLARKIGDRVNYAAYPAATNPWANTRPACEPSCPSWTSRAVEHTPLNPLQISRAGSVTRTFDINYDGLAHFGMLPDFLQELRVLGTDGEEMGAVFRSAEALIKMWEESCYLAYQDPARPRSIAKGCGSPDLYR